MHGFLSMLLVLIFPLLVLALSAAVLVRRSLKRSRLPRRSTLTDEMIQRIIHDGTLALDDDEPLDSGRIREEEERFWRGATWDEPEPF